MRWDEGKAEVLREDRDEGDQIGIDRNRKIHALLGGKGTA